MKPFRKNVAIAIDGGGIKGILVTKALSVLEEALGKPVHEIFHLAVGTSTGSIISAGIGAGISAHRMSELYLDLGKSIFPHTLRSALWPLMRYRYSNQPLKEALARAFGAMEMGDFWLHEPPIDVVITTFDLLENRTRFIKPWKKDYASWSVAEAVQCSCTVPTYFPVVKGRFIDGGVGSYSNPCYLAAYEASVCLNWDPAETTLISLGTGRDPHTFSTHRTQQLWPWQWLEPILGAFLQSADDQQVNLVETFFRKLDFRRFQIDLRQPIEMDDPAKIPELDAYGVRMGRMILSDRIDPVQKRLPETLNSNRIPKPF